MLGIVIRSLVHEQNPKPQRFGLFPKRGNRYSPVAQERKMWLGRADLRGHCDGTALAGRGWQ